MPIFESMTTDVAKAAMALTKDQQTNAAAKKFVPKAGMTLRAALA